MDPASNHSPQYIPPNIEDLKAAFLRLAVFVREGDDKKMDFVFVNIYDNITGLEQHQPSRVSAINLERANQHLISSAEASVLNNKVEACAQALEGLRYNPHSPPHWRALAEGLLLFGQNELADKAIAFAARIVERTAQRTDLAGDISELISDSVSKEIPAKEMTAAVGDLFHNLLRIVKGETRKLTEVSESAIETLMAIAETKPEYINKDSVRFCKSLAQAGERLYSPFKDIALNLAIEALSDNPAHPRAWQLTAHLLTRVGAEHAAYNLLSQARKLSPNDQSIASDHAELAASISDPTARPILVGHQQLKDLVKSDIEALSKS